MLKIKELFKKSPTAMVVAGLVIAGVASATVLTYYATINGETIVEQAVLVDGKKYDEPITGEWNGSTKAGNTTIGLHTLKNNAEVPATIDFSTTCKKATWADSLSPSTAEDIDWTDRCDGIITRYVEYFDDAGATGYVAPTHCNATVVSTTNLQTAISGASADIVICVSPATYGKITIPAVVFDITLASTDGPETTIIDAVNAGNGITVNGGTGTGTVTIEGFTIQNYGKEGILVDGRNVVIKYNVIQASEVPSTVSSVDAIYTKGGATVTVDHNDLGNNQWHENTRTGQPDPSAWSTAAGLSVHQGDTVTATYNVFDNNDFGIHVKGLQTTIPTTSPIVIANYNNFLNTNAVDFFYEKIAGDTTTPFNATNNWWGTSGIDIAAGDSTGLIPIDSYINANWMTKTDMELTSGEFDKFGIINEFNVALMPDSYTITTEVVPAE